jgi:hypothetical protein
MNCNDGSWLYVYAGLTPWVQAVLAFVFFGFLASIAVSIALYRSKPVQMVHYIAKED